MLKTRVDKVQRGIYEKLLHMAPNHQDDAERYYQELPANSPLRKIPKEQLSPSFMPRAASLHDTKTNNAAEVPPTHRLVPVLVLNPKPT
jgi:hypothetical protein